MPYMIHLNNLISKIEKVYKHKLTQSNKINNNRITLFVIIK